MNERHEVATSRFHYFSDVLVHSRALENSGTEKPEHQGIRAALVASFISDKERCEDDEDSLDGLGELDSKAKAIAIVMAREAAAMSPRFYASIIGLIMSRSASRTT